MILSKEVLDKIEFYESERFTGNGGHSTVILHWKKQWWQFWKKPTIIRTRCRRATGKNEVVMLYADEEWEELSEQLRQYFLNVKPSPENPAKLFAVNFKKDTDDKKE